MTEGPSYRAVFYAEDGSIITLWQGTYAECVAYQAGAHANSETDYVVVLSPFCSCGPNRQEIENNTPPFHRRGCLRCGTWDGPPVYVGYSSGGRDD